MTTTALQILRNKRKELRYTLADVAERAGVSVSVISDAERGRRTATEHLEPKGTK